MSETVLSWGLTYLLHSTILIGTIWVANLRMRSSFLRDLLWKIALVGGIVTATISSVRPFELTLPRSTASLTDERMSVGIPGSSQEGPGISTGASLPIGASHVGAVPDQIVMNPGHLATAGAIIATTAPVLLLLWLAGFVLLAARLLIGHSHLMQRLKDREAIVTGRDFEILQKLRARDSMRSVRLSMTGAVSSPIAMIGSEIVIPRDMFQRLSLAQRESILAHELAHVQRRDPLWLCLTEMVCAILFLQPLNRLVRREMKETAEFLCDDAALRQTGDRRALAETLAELASMISPARASTVAAMAEGGSNLFRRVSRVLYEDGAADKPLRPSVRLALVVLPLLLVTGLAPAIDARAVRDTDAVQASEGAVIDVEAPIFAIAAAEDRPEENVNTSASAAGSGKQKAETTFYATGSKARSDVVPHQRLSDAVLSQSFDGPEGATSVAMKAHAAEVALDGSWVRFFEADGFLRARQESDRGPVREVEITAGRNLEAKYVYRVDGETHDWCSDAEKVVAASFLAEKAYDNWEVAGPKASGGGTVQTTSGTSRTTRSDLQRPNWSDHLEWRANVENETKTAEGLHRLRIRASGVHYNPKTAEVWIEPDGSLDVTESRGSTVRTFSRTADGVNWSSDGEWAGDDDAARVRWLVEVLRANSSLSRAVIESFARD